MSDSLMNLLISSSSNILLNVLLVLVKLDKGSLITSFLLIILGSIYSVYI